MAQAYQNQTNVKFYKTAGITVEVRSDFPISENTFHPKFKKFEVDGPGEDNVLILHHFYSPEFSLDRQPTAEEIYNKDQWRIFKGNNSWIYDFKSILPIDPGHCATGVFNEDYTALSVHTTNFDRLSYQNARLPALTLFNNDQVMFAPLLSDRNGLILHSNGFDINGNGVLLAGTSGVGKSTLSRMLKHYGFKILCDDRMFVTGNGSNFRIHGNWCHGTVPDTATGDAPLKAVLFLEHADLNAIEKIRDNRGASHHLLRSLVQPFLPSSGWINTLDIIEGMMKEVACYKVKFNLSGKICQMISDLFK